MDALFFAIMDLMSFLTLVSGAMAMNRMMIAMMESCQEL